MAHEGTQGLTPLSPETVTAGGPTASNWHPLPRERAGVRARRAAGPATAAAHELAPSPAGELEGRVGRRGPRRAQKNRDERERGISPAFHHPKAAPPDPRPPRWGLAGCLQLHGLHFVLLVAGWSAHNS